MRFGLVFDNVLWSKPLVTLLTSHEVKEARPAAEDGDEDDEESGDLGHHLQLVPRGV